MSRAVTGRASTSAPSPGIDFGHAVVIVRGRHGTPSGRIGVRTAVVVVALAAAALLVALIALATGAYTMSPAEVAETLLGGGSRAQRLAVVEWRMPRVLAALMIGAALGVSGAIFQSITRNPLGSPDVIGFNTGAYSGALVVMLVLGTGGFFLTAAGALVGGVATALAVYFLAFTRGVQGFRLIIVGIALSAVLASVNTWLILKAELELAMAAATWGAGSLNGLGWVQVVPLSILFAVVSLAAVALVRRIPILDLGDDAARALGVRTEPTRLALVVVGVAFTALATAAAGPISFVALSAPQLARRLTRSAGVSLLPAALMGALLLALADLLAQRLAPTGTLPVGVVTVSIGGLYLVWLLAREARRQ